MAEVLPLRVKAERNRAAFNNGGGERRPRVYNLRVKR